MKNLKLLFLVALFCGFVLNSNAQSEVRYWEAIWTFQPNCDGVGDVITGPVHGYVVDHFNPVTGAFEWYKFNIKSAELVSEITGEKFSISGKDKGTTTGSFGGVAGDMYFKYHRNLIGKQGSHYLVTIIWSYDVSTNTWTLVEREIKCP